jgi:thiocyanate desulfurase
MNQFPSFKPPTSDKPSLLRLARFQCYRLLKGELITRRDVLTASAAGAAGMAIERLFGFGINFSSSKVNEAVSQMVPKIEVVDAKKCKQSVERLGNYVYLTPEKLGGGTHAVNLGTGKTMAWISYWNYGDSCPISHHLSAYPSPDPTKHFEFVNSTQGGDNVMIYGLPTPIKERGLLDKWGQGNHIYRVNFDGQSMNLLEDVSQSTGMGLGVHTTIYPDATGFAGADGQKDICAFFNRPAEDQKTKVLAAFRADWVANERGGSLEDNWSKGGRLRIVRLVEAKETGKFDLEGSKGNKLNWEMVPMAEYLVYTGQLPGDDPRGLTGLDAVVHHPGNRYSALIIRMLSCAVIVDRTTWEPITCLHNPEGSPDNLKVTKVSSNPDTWEVKFDDVKSVGHEAGFSPNGKFFTMMNNIKQNNMAVFDTSAADPHQWKRITFVKDPTWVGDYPSPFHLCFSMDGSKMFVSVLYPKPASSGCCVVDTKTWRIIKKFQNIGPDCQTMSVSYDGKYVFQIFSGFQRMESGVFIFTQDTLEPYGYLPNFGGHHDCVIVPTKVEHLRNSRCTTL